LAAAQLRDEHRLEDLHGRADLPVAAFLEEEEAEAVGPVAVLLRQDERVEGRLDRVLLGAEAQPAGQTELGISRLVFVLGREFCGAGGGGGIRVQATWLLQVFNCTSRPLQTNTRSSLAVGF
jgi:hypothetical protein